MGNQCLHNQDSSDFVELFQKADSSFFCSNIFNSLLTLEEERIEFGTSATFFIIEDTG